MSKKPLPRTHGLFGWIGENSYLPEVLSDAMEKAFLTELPVTLSTSERWGVGSTGAVTSTPGGGIAAIIGAPYWKTNALREVATTRSHAAALAEAYDLAGDKYYELLAGTFSCAIVDTAKQRTMICVDRMGHFPMYFTTVGESLIFSNSLGCVMGHPEVRREVCPQGVYNYVYFHMLPSPISIFRDVKKLHCGSQLVFENGELAISRYWQPEFQEFYGEHFNIQKNNLRHRLTRSVEHAISDGRQIGAFLSGGLDSSTVVGILSEVQGKNAKAFSIGFSAKGYDEMPFARNTAKHFDVKLHEYYVTPADVVEALPKIASSYDEPFGNSSALPAWFCARFAAEQGIEHLLAGDGGDELFAGNERYAKQKIFERYYGLPSLLSEKLIPGLVRMVGTDNKLGRKADSYIRQALIPLPDRLQTYNYLHRHNPAEVFNPQFLDQLDTEIPIKLIREVYNAPDEASPLNRMLYLDWQYTLADNDLRKVSHMCALAGVDVSYPFLEDHLVKFSTRIPSRQKLKGRKLRYFYKKALENWLPEATINKKKQGFGLPFGVWMSEYQPLRDMSYDNLQSLKARGYFQEEFLEKLIDLHRHGHAHYYGELIWVLVVLEFWLDAHL